MFRKISAASLFLLLVGCGSTLTPTQTAYVDNLTPCEKIRGLVDGFENQFEPLKATRVQTKFGDVWTPKYHLLGNSCQILGMNNERVSYKCAKQYDTESQSRDAFDLAVNQVAQCLGSQWQTNNTAQNQSQRTTFKNAEHDAVISIQSGQTNAKYNKTWQTSFEVGGLVKK